MPIFNHPSLLWALPVIALPVLIHLINMLRHRRVQWGAMEFLLKAQKKNRRWILLRQLLLLLSRMAAVAVVVLIVSQAVLPSEWTELLGGSSTHHVVLLDDSFSMADRQGDTMAFDRAKQAIRDLGTRLAGEKSSQEFTLLTFSLADTKRPLLAQEGVDSDFQGRLAEVLDGLVVSHTSAGPVAAVEAIDRLPSKKEDETRIVYVISDFRAAQWQDATDLNRQLSRLADADTQIDLVSCVKEVRPNLAIESLGPAPGPRAAGVPLRMNVAVHNFGEQTRRNVSITLNEDGTRRAGVVIPEIGPGKTVTRDFQVLFESAGTHTVSGQLGDDAVVADNARFCVVQLDIETPVLVIDEDPLAHDAKRLSWALNPRGKAKTGVSPRIERPSFLRDHALDEYAAVYLLNFKRLDPSAIERVEAYANSGGGVAFFVGENTDATFINRSLYRDGEGLFPLPLLRSIDLPVDRLNKSPDLEVTDHPIFSIFRGERNSFINTVLVERYFAAADGWTATAESGAKVIARLRNGAPLAVERNHGDGRVIAVLTKASPVDTPIGRWNNWGSNNPSYVITLQETQAYLGDGRMRDDDRRVGSVITANLDRGDYSPQVTFTTPHEEGSPLATLVVDATRSKEDLAVMSATLGAENQQETSLPGVYEAQLTRSTGVAERRAWSLNVDASEGDLAVTGPQELAVRLGDLPYRYYLAETLSSSPRQQAGSNVSTWLLLLMVGLLVGEQVLAYSAGYHRSVGKGAGR